MLQVLDLVQKTRTYLGKGILMDLKVIDDKNKLGLGTLDMNKSK